MIEILQRLDRIEAALVALLKQGQVQDWYDTKAAAKKLDKSPYTVRQYCRLERIHAEKRCCGRGKSKEWRISHEELMRIEAEGLLPAPMPCRGRRPRQKVTRSTTGEGPR